MANLTSRTAFTGTLAGSDIFYGITTPGGTPQEWKIPLSKLADLYATAAQGDLADSALQPADVVWVEKAGDTMTGELEFSQPAGDTWQFMSVSPNDPDNEGFNWNIAASDNPSIARRNVIMNWGYNNAVGGGSQVSGEPTFYHQLESHYAPGSNPQFEYHWDFGLANGSIVRPLHLNCIHSGANEGDVNFYWYSDQMNWGAAHDGQFIMLVLNSGATLATSQFKVLAPTEHRQLITFANTDHAGLRLNNLTTAQRDALTASSGMLIYNTTTGRAEWRGASAWQSVPITADFGELASEDWPASDGQEYVAKNGAWAVATGGGSLTPPVVIEGPTATMVPLSVKSTDDDDTNYLVEFRASDDSVVAGIWNTGEIDTFQYFAIGGDRVLHKTGTSNLFAGINAGNFTLSGTENAGVGSLALNGLTSGGNNVAIGTNALLNLTTGSNNVAIGRRVLSNYNGSNTVAIGVSALGALTSGTNNVAVGVSALGAISTNGASTAIGASALSTATGSGNTAIGSSAGQTLTTGSNNTFLGANASVSTNSISNSIALGYNAQVTKNGQFVIGSAAVPITEFTFAGATAAFAYRPTDTATTNAVVNIATFRLNSSGTPAAGFGPGLLIQGESTTTENQDMGRLTYEWATATHASRAARGKLSAYDTAERECIRIEASGSAPMLGVLGAAAIARQAHIADPSGGGTQDTEARTAINAILAALESFGFLATS